MDFMLAVSLNLPRLSLPYEHAAGRQHSSSHMSLSVQCNFVFNTVKFSTKQHRLKAFTELKGIHGRNYSKYRAVCNNPTFLSKVQDFDLHIRNITRLTQLAIRTSGGGEISGHDLGEIWITPCKATCSQLP